MRWNFVPRTRYQTLDIEKRRFVLFLWLLLKLSSEKILIYIYKCTFVSSQEMCLWHTKWSLERFGTICLVFDSPPGWTTICWIPGSRSQQSCTQLSPGFVVSLLIFCWEKPDSCENVLHFPGYLSWFDLLHVHGCNIGFIFNKTKRPNGPWGKHKIHWMLIEFLNNNNKSSDEYAYHIPHPYTDLSTPR